MTREEEHAGKRLTTCDTDREGTDKYEVCTEHHMNRRKKKEPGYIGADTSRANAIKERDPTQITISEK